MANPIGGVLMYGRGLTAEVLNWVIIAFRIFGEIASFVSGENRGVAGNTLCVWEKIFLGGSK